ENHGQVIESSWDAAVKSSGADTLPNQESGQKLSSDLSEIEPKFVASGHGFCITIVG
ncbi:MBL fold metallo-hydrolase, partial [Salmonella enterica subsp. enterica serovar Typhimurium]|nr:MBL fold metallo-hydrolase [Salmonella enterica subsp. enterica serovar Typhimurium]